MTSIWSKFKAKDAASTPTTAAPAKKDPNAPQPTPLELMLADAGPLRNDGSDKFFGFENFGSTCYANSVIQCLYYSAPFRDLVINFPARSPIETLQKARDAGLPKLVTDAGTTANGSAMSPKKTVPVAAPGTPGFKPEDKDSPEYKKKQALAAGPYLNMDYENADAYGMSNTLFSSLKDMFEAIIANQSRIGVVSPNKFLEILKAKNDMFRAAMHQDAHEFLNYLLNEVVDDVENYSKEASIAAPEPTKDTSLAIANALTSVVRASIPDEVSTKERAKNTKWVHELFEGTLTSETRCLTCENTSQRDEPFLDLSVDLEQHSSVTSCLRKFSEEEMLRERNKFHCDKCGGLQEAEKRMKIKRLPKILALHLKRFKYTEDLQRLQKLFHRVVYPYYLRLFNTTDDAEDPDRLYELYAVVVHIGGGPYHGHYVSIIKTQDRGWVLFDDEMVEPVDKAYVRNFFGGLNAQGQNALACAYVLFYQETTEEAMQKEQEAEGLAAAQKAAEREKEAMQAGKLNGTANGMPLTPTVEEIDKFQNLAHAATAPGLSPIPVPADPMPITVNTTGPSDQLEHAVTSPATAVASSVLPQPLAHDKKAEALAKKERKHAEKEEKARLKVQEKEAKAAKKAADKEREKELITRNRELMEKRRLARQKEEEDFQAVLEASKQTAAEDATRAATESTTTEATATTMSDHDHPHNTANGADPHLHEHDVTAPLSIPKRPSTSNNLAAEEFTSPSSPSAKKENKFGLNRFRQSSMSLRQHKPKWLGHKDKSESADYSGVASPENGKEKDATKEKGGKGVFGGLSRKKSSLLPS